MTEPIYQGWTQTPIKHCIRCNGIADSALYELCQVCRSGDALAELFDSELVAVARKIHSEMLDSISTIQWNKAEYALKMWADSMSHLILENAEYYLNEARIFLRTEYQL
jgi:hypothetical protein